MGWWGVYFTPAKNPKWKPAGGVAPYHSSDYLSQVVALLYRRSYLADRALSFTMSQYGYKRTF